MKTPDQILAEHEDANEMHLHQVDREWVIKAMEEYAKSRQVWIRPQDQMPKDGELVLINDVDGIQIVACFIIDFNKWYSGNHSWFPNEVTYWMYIPEIV